MDREKLDFGLEKVKKYRTVNQVYVYLKGWVFTSSYIISVVQRNQEVARFSGNKTRQDVAVKHGDKRFLLNEYGFEKMILLEDDSVFELFVLSGSIRVLIDQTTMVKKTKTNKIKSYFVMIRKALTFFWRDYRFIVPPLMIKKYFSEFKEKRKTIDLGNAGYYDQNIDYEYWMWIENKEGQEEGLESAGLVSYLVEGEISKIDPVLSKIAPNFIFSYDNFKNIETKYCCIVREGNILGEQFSTILDLLHDQTLVYFDHDLICNGKRGNPIFAPDYSFDSLLGYDYIGGVAIFKTSFLKRNAQYIQNIHRLCLEAKNDKVQHINKIMYHNLFDSSMELYQSTEKYLNDHAIKANIQKNYDESMVVIYEVIDEPKVSIIIPTKDHVEDLEKCLKSIFEISTYQNFEVIVVDNNSEEERTEVLLEHYSMKYPNFEGMRLECEFNFSYLNNEAVKKSKGEYLLFLNNDTEVITKNWIELMLGYAQLSEIGTVGVKLLFEDDTIQHAGLVLGKGGIAGHANYGKNRYYAGQQSELLIPYNCSGSTAACLMISKEKFNDVSGFEEELAVAYNDVDLNLRILQKGLRNIYLPNVELYHYESKSRGLDTTVEKQKRFLQESRYMKTTWESMLVRDAYYNDNYSKNYDYLLAAKE